MSTNSWRNRLTRVAAWFLAFSYGIGGPFTAFVEFQQHALSEKFGLPAALIYVTCVIQAVCAVLVVNRRYAFGAAAALRVVTVGAIGSHLRIESPVTAIPAIAFTALQVWFGLEARSNLGTTAAE